MKATIAALLIATTLAANAQTTYVLPSPEVSVGLSFSGNPCSFGNPKVSIVVNDPTYAGGDPIRGPLTWTRVTDPNTGWPADEFTGTFTTPNGQTATYSQLWDLHYRGGRGFTCWFVPSGGTLEVQ